MAQNFQEIEKYWNSMSLVEYATPDNRLGKSVNGLYALKHPQYGIVYIGKGKPIFNRIKSHYYATKGKEKAPAWKQFFEYVTDDITVYWFEVDNTDPIIGEQTREVLERLLQIKYKPLFETLYRKGMRKELPDIDQAVKEVFTGKYT